MAGKDTLVVDPSEIPGETASEVPASTQRKQEKPKAQAPKPPAKPTEAPKAPAAQKAEAPKKPEAKAAPASKAQAPKSPTKPVEQKLNSAPAPVAVGTKVAYLGEARGTLKRGANGTISKQHRLSQTLYEVKFGSETHLLPATHIQKL